MSNFKLHIQTILVTLCVVIPPSISIAEVIYIDSRNGDDANPGTKEKPLQTIGKAAELVNNSKEAGPTIMKISPGVYNLTKTALFRNTRSYTEKKRLTIEATVLPDDPNWLPKFMPTIISTEVPQQWGKTEAQIETSGLKVEISHVTIRGLKFLGHPIPDSKYWPIRRDGKDLKDLVVAQCLFMGNRYIQPIQVAVIARGNEIVVDRCIFYDCKNAVVLWDAEGGDSRGCVMRYCIVDGAYTSGVWVTQTAEDFEFHHNIITRSRYAWMRDSANRKKYRLQDCIITNNKHYSGKCDDDWTLSQTGPEITYGEERVAKEGRVILEMGKGEVVSAKERERPRNYLHVKEGTFGSELGAGLFKSK